MKRVFGTIDCLECLQPVECKNNRDLKQKKFCSKSCRSIYVVRNRPGGNTFGKLKQDFGYKICIQCKKNMKCKNRRDVEQKKFCSRTCCAIHTNYIEDRSKIKNQRRGSEFIEWRKTIFQRDNYTCLHCGQIGGRLQADHIKSWAMYPELRFDINNGQTLCVDCHKKTDTYGRSLSVQRRLLNA